jgi:hypothetical protein
MKAALLLELLIGVLPVAAFREGRASGHAEAGPAMLFKMIEALAPERPFTLDSVSRTTGATLRKTSANDYFAMFNSAAGARAPVTAVELRLPVAAGSKRDGLLILDIDPAARITKEMVMAQFGSQPVLSVPEPAAPYEVSYTYHQYRPGVDLHFQFARRSGFLVAAILDAIEPPPAAMAAKWLDVFIAYPGARELCRQHVQGSTMHILWRSYVTGDPPEKVIAFYTKAEGKERAEQDGNRVTFRHGDKVLSIHAAPAKDYPDCGKPPGPLDKTVLIVSEATRR